MSQMFERGAFAFDALRAGLRLAAQLVLRYQLNSS